jgi:hypothetical protein
VHSVLSATTAHKFSLLATTGGSSDSDGPLQRPDPSHFNSDTDPDSSDHSGQDDDKKPDESMPVVMTDPDATVVGSIRYLDETDNAWWEELKRSRAAESVSLERRSRVLGEEHAHIDGVEGEHRSEHAEDVTTRRDRRSRVDGTDNQLYNCANNLNSRTQHEDQYEYQQYYGDNDADAHLASRGLPWQRRDFLPSAVVDEGEFEEDDDNAADHISELSESSALPHDSTSLHRDNEEHHGEFGSHQSFDDDTDEEEEEEEEDDEDDNEDEEEEEEGDDDDDDEHDDDELDELHRIRDQDHVNQVGDEDDMSAEGSRHLDDVEEEEEEEEDDEEDENEVLDVDEEDDEVVDSEEIEHHDHLLDEEVHHGLDYDDDANHESVPRTPTLSPHSSASTPEISSPFTDRIVDTPVPFVLPANRRAAGNVALMRDELRTLLDRQDNDGDTPLHNAGT